MKLNIGGVVMTGGWLRCPKHPKYRVIKPPRGACKICKQLYKELHG